MENGFVILGIIALLFLSMYGYAYFSVSMEKMKQRREAKIEAKILAKKEDLIRQKRLENQKLIEERIKKFNDRRKEIQHELMLLEKMKHKQKVS